MAIGTESFMRNIVPSLVELLLADRPTSRGQILRESIVWLVFLAFLGNNLEGRCLFICLFRSLLRSEVQISIDSSAW